MREAVEALFEPGPHAMDEVAREIPIVERIADMDHAVRRSTARPTKIASQSNGASTMGYGKPRWMTANRVAEIDSQTIPTNIDKRIKEKSAVSPCHGEISHHRAGQHELHQRGDAERKAPPIARRHVGG